MADQPKLTVGPAVVKEKPRVVSTKGPMQKINGLGCISDVRGMFASGWELTKIAEFIQETKHELIGWSRKYLVDQLRTWKGTLPAMTLEHRDDLVKSAQVEREKVVQGINELDELRKLYELQMNRIAIDVAVEQKLHKLLPTMTKEIEQAREILVAIGERKEAMGILVPLAGDAGTSALPAGEGGVDTPVGRVLSSAEASHRVLGLMSAMTRLAQERAMIDTEAEAKEETEVVEVSGSSVDAKENE